MILQAALYQHGAKPAVWLSTHLEVDTNKPVSPVPSLHLGLPSSVHFIWYNLALSEPESVGFAITEECVSVFVEVREKHIYFFKPEKLAHLCIIIGILELRLL